MSSWQEHLTMQGVDQKAWTPHVQVAPQHYRAGYDDGDKWVTYYWVVSNVLARNLQQVLEVGVYSSCFFILEKK